MDTVSLAVRETLEVDASAGKRYQLAWIVACLQRHSEQKKAEGDKNCQ